MDNSELLRRLDNGIRAFVVTYNGNSQACELLRDAKGAIEIAAQRLESLSQVTEAEVEAAARALADIESNHDEMSVYREMARAALEAARNART